MLLLIYQTQVGRYFSVYMRAFTLLLEGAFSRPCWLLDSALDWLIFCFSRSREFFFVLLEELEDDLPIISKRFRLFSTHLQGKVVVTFLG